MYNRSKPNWNISLDTRPLPPLVAPVDERSDMQRMIDAAREAGLQPSDVIPHTLTVDAQPNEYTMFETTGDDAHILIGSISVSIFRTLDGVTVKLFPAGTTCAPLAIATASFEASEREIAEYNAEAYRTSPYRTDRDGLIPMYGDNGREA